MQIINYAHPLTPEQISQLESMFDSTTLEIKQIKSQFDLSAPFAEQATQLVDQAALTPQQWQTEPLAVLLPALNFGAAVVLVELHGRCGYFPPIIRLRPVKEATPPRFEVAEIINLQALRATAREKR